MLLERIYDEDLAQAGYLIGCQAKGEALVVDARRDVQHYLDLAAQHGMTITGVTENQTTLTMALASFAAAMRDRLLASERAMRWLNRSFAAIFATLGARLALEKTA